MRRILALAACCWLVASAAAAQTSPQSAAAKADTLSLEQKTRISQLVTKQTAPLTIPGFSVVVDGVVPPAVELHSLPAEAEQVAPQLRGFDYVVVEELVAIVDPRTRKVAVVFPRWAQ